MSQKPQKVSEAGRSPREIGEAIAQLSDSELLRLRKFARFRVRGIGLAAEGVSAEDVLQEAVTLTLSDERRWYSDDISEHL